MKYIILILITAFFISCNNNDIAFKEGRWEGQIDTGINNLNLVIDYDGSDAYLSIAEQGLIKVKVSQLTINKKLIKFNLNIAQTVINFEGERIISENNDVEVIKGSYLQNGQKRDFNLSYKGPIPAEKEYDILKDSGSDKIIVINRDEIQLSAKLRIPFQDNSNWVALIIPGSGPTDGDGNSKLLNGDNNSLLRLANALSDNGIVSLRVDKRGTGISSDFIINEEEQDFSILIDDVKAWVLKIKEMYPEKKLAIIGHSQGSLVSMIVANEIGCDSLISISASGYPIDETLIKQLSIVSEDYYNQGKMIISELKKGNLVENVPASLHLFFRPSVQPFLISYMKYNPQEVIKKADYPILLIQGGNDSQTSKEDVIKLYDFNPNSKLVIIEKMNHLLRDVDTVIENQMTYGEDRLALSPSLINEIMIFIDSI